MSCYCMRRASTASGRQDWCSIQWPCSVPTISKSVESPFRRLKFHNEKVLCMYDASSIVCSVVLTAKSVKIMKSFSLHHHPGPRCTYICFTRQYRKQVNISFLWFIFLYFKPLKTNTVWVIFKNPVRTSKRTPHFTITQINWLTLFKFNPLKTKLV
jgi:hypothetical protein